MLQLLAGPLKSNIGHLSRDAERSGTEHLCYWFLRQTLCERVAAATLPGDHRLVGYEQCATDIEIGVSVRPCFRSHVRGKLRDSIDGHVKTRFARPRRRFLLHRLRSHCSLKPSQGLKATVNDSKKTLKRLKSQVSPSPSREVLT